MVIVERVAKDEQKMNYIVFYSKNYIDLPLMIYLHRAGERDKVLLHLDRHGIPKLISEGKEIPAVILCPQCPAEYVWDNVVKDLKNLIDETVIKFGIKKDRICITRSSMGGYGTWMMGLTYGNYFSAIAPVAGGGMSWRISKLKTMPVYAVHGKLDGIDYAYRNTDLIEWLLSKRRTDFSEISEVCSECF